MSPDFTVRLERVFQGPMDLLLHLVKEQEVEIQEVRIAAVIDDYFGYLEALENLDIEVAGEFLVMAATLMAIKSRSLLPREEIELEDVLDPEDELIQRLLEYRRFKGAADDLEARFERRMRECARGYRGELRDHEPERTLDLGELTIFDLLAAFSRLVRETLANRPHLVRRDPHPLRWYVRAVGHALRTERVVGLRRLVEVSVGEVPPREGLVGVFCALLELVKLGVITARQEAAGDEIRVSLADHAADDLDELISASRFMDEFDDVPDGLRPTDADGLEPGEAPLVALPVALPEAVESAARGVDESSDTDPIPAPPPPETPRQRDEPSR